MRQRIIVLVALPLVALLAAAAQAGDLCCSACGCTHGAHQVARLVCEMQTVPCVEYATICEDVCVTRSIWDPAILGGCVQRQPCGPCDGVDLTTQVRQRQRLVKRVVYKQTPAYRWVVEYGCACGSTGNPAAPAN